MSKPLAFYYSWQNVTDSMIPNVMSEFRDNGANDLVFSHIWLHRMILEPAFFPNLKRMALKAGINLVSPHGLWSAGYDLNTPNAERRAEAAREHIQAMSYAAELGAKTYTIHVGAYESVFFGTPNAELRKYAVGLLEKLIAPAERLGIVIAVENSYERSNTPDEALYLVKYFNTPSVGCCFDVGHANIMDPGAGKDHAKYSDELMDAWNGRVEEYPNAFEAMKPYIVTTHMHDNSGYADQHLLPGKGTINWPELIAKLRSAPKLMSFQTEVRTDDGLSVKTLVEKFRELFPDKF